MSQLIRANYEMTKEEAVLVNGLMDKAEGDFRFYLLQMREEKGWKALGYASFDDYGKQARGLNGARLYQLAQAAEIQLSLPNSKILEKTPDSQLRPLAPLTDNERRQVWEEATAIAEEENRKLTAKLVQEAVDRLQAEKSQLQATLELTEQRTSDWRLQALDKEKALKELDQKAKVAQTEAATLRRTLALEAEKLAEAKILEVRAALNAEKDKAAKLDASVKSLKREREDAINRGVSNKLREKEQELNDKEAQLVGIEKRIAFLDKELQPLKGAFAIAEKHKPKIAMVDDLLNRIAVAITDAFEFNPEQGADIPEDILRQWERGVSKMSDLQIVLTNAINNGMLQ